jgi:hypothetical protein
MSGFEVCNTYFTPLASVSMSMLREEAGWAQLIRQVARRGRSDPTTNLIEDGKGEARRGCLYARWTYPLSRTTLSLLLFLVFS